MSDDQQGAPADLETVRRLIKELEPCNVLDHHGAARRIPLWLRDEVLPALCSIVTEVERFRQGDLGWLYNIQRAEIGQLRRKVHALKTMSTVEMMCENESVRQHITEWEQRCLKAEAENEDLKKSLEGIQRHNRVDAEDMRRWPPSAGTMK